MAIRLMVLDVAGTTVRDDGDAVARAVCAALANVGVNHPLAAVDPLMGMPKPLAIGQLLLAGRNSVPAEEEVARVHADFRARMIDHYRTSHEVGPMPGVDLLFRTLRERGIRIALDTGFDRLILDAILDRLGWANLVDDTVASDEVAHGRPHPDMINVLMRRAGIADPTCVGKVGDSLSDLEEGLAAQCGLVVAILGQRTAPHMARFPSVVGVRTLPEIVEHLQARTLEQVSSDRP